MISSFQYLFVIPTAFTEQFSKKIFPNIFP